MDYTDYNRGVIQSRLRKKQIIDFRGLRFGDITPTDIDGIFDWHGKGFVIYEYKLRDAAIPYGQGLCYTRLADDICNGGKDAFILHCQHDMDNPHEDIDASEAKVSRIYHQGEWHTIRTISAREATEIILEDWEMK